MGDRLSALDASFLHLETEAAHMHVASVMLFDGDPPSYDDFSAAIERRLHLVPRYRQRLALVPFGQGRPRWVDDPHFNLSYHVRQTALPPPGSEEQLRNLASRVLAQQLDRDKPLWELWLVESVEDGRFAIVAKTHHALVDGVSGVDIATVLFDASATPEEPPEPPPRWLPAPEPSDSQLLAEALIERGTAPGEIVRSARAVFRAPRQLASALRDSVATAGSMFGAPASPYNRRIGPHRRFTWARVSLDDVKAIKNELGGTVNDVVLSVVAGGLGLHLRGRGEDTTELTLRAMVPVSVRAETERGALGNRVSAMMAPLPVWCEDPVERLTIVSEAMAGLKESGQAVGADRIMGVADFAPPTILGQAARLSHRQRAFNLVVTNVPGPQFPLFMLGRELRDLFPMVPLTSNTALGVALMSYNGAINFGLVGDYDAMADIQDVADDFEGALGELAAAAGVKLGGTPRKPRRAATKPRAKAKTS